MRREALRDLDSASRSGLVRKAMMLGIPSTSKHSCDITVRAGLLCGKEECTNLHVPTAAGCVHKHGYHFEGQRDIGFGLSSAEASECANADKEQRCTICKFALEFGLSRRRKVGDEFLENYVADVPVATVPRGEVPRQEAIERWIHCLRKQLASGGKAKLHLKIGVQQRVNPKRAGV